MMNVLKSFITISNFLAIISQYCLYHCVISVRIRSYYVPYFPAFGLYTEGYSVSLLIHSPCDIFKISCFSCQRVHQEQIKSWLNHVERL